MNLYLILNHIYIILFSCLWIGAFGWTIRTLLLVPVFEECITSSPKNTVWPSVSIIVPARNEKDTIAESLKTILGLDYPNLEIIIVNDRSTDGTGALIDRFCEQNNRVRTIHIETLPEGWLGKVHALDTGSRQATGEWLLFTDADIHFSPSVLKRALTLGKEKDCDHIALLPSPKASSFWLDVFQRTFGMILLNNIRSINKNPTVGIGAFNLVKQKTFSKTRGFSWLRMEILDDYGIGKLVKDAGGTTFLAVARQAISLVWYPSVSAMFSGVEKNFFGAFARYSLSRMFILCSVIFGFACVPPAALWSAQPLYIGLGLFSYILLILAAIVGNRRFKNGFSASLFCQIGLIAIILMLVRSAAKCIREGGVTWRDTPYKVKDLKKNQRVFM